MVQLKQLERSLETSIAEGNLASSEKTIDSYLDESIPIDAASSSKLHDMLLRVASTTVSHRGEPSPVLVAALVRLCPCITNRDQLRVWFDMLVPLALDSGGRENTLVARSREFLQCVLSGDFYTEELQSQYDQNSLSFFAWLVDIYVGKGRLVISTIPMGKDTTATDEYWTEERRRFVRFNCRSLIVEHASKDPAGAFTVLNKYLLVPEQRLDILQVVSEFVATWQTGKLFKVFDTPLFESLLNCLEYDKPAPALSAASTTLAMLLPHVCDKLVPILPRILACFGRLCSWQPSSESPAAHQASAPSPKNGWVVLYETAPQDTIDPDRIPKQTLEELVAGDGSDAESESEDSSAAYSIDVAPFFTFIYGLFPANVINFCRQSDEYLTKHQYTRNFTDFWSRFMVRQRAEKIANQFLLHPLVLSQNSEQEIAGSDARWQSYHSTSSLAIFCAGLRVPDVSAVVDDQERALDILLEDHQRRFQEATARINIVAPILDAHRNPASGDGTRAGSPSPTQSQPATNMWTSFGRSRSASAGASASGPRVNAAVIEREKETLASAPQSPGLMAKPSPYLRPSLLSRSSGNISGSGQLASSSSAGVTAFFQRELLLNKNELDFANFCRYISERRVVRLQKQVRNLSMVQLRNEDLTRKSKQLSQKLETFEEQAEKSQRSARILLRERTAYASTLIEKNRDFRSRIQILEDQIQEMQEQLVRAHTERDIAVGEAADNSARVSTLEMAQSGLNQRYDEATTKLKDISDHMKAVGNERHGPASRDLMFSREFAEARLEIQGLKEDKECAAAEHRREISQLKKELAKLMAKPTIPSPMSSSQNDVAGVRDEEIVQLRAARDALAQQCTALETELRARKVHEEERLNELRMALMSARPFNGESGLTAEPRFKGRGGAQGTVRW